MKRALVVLFILIILASLGLIIRARRSPRGPVLTEDEIMKLVADRAVPTLVRTAALSCNVPNPAADRTVDLSLVVRTLEHGVELTSVRLSPDAGAPPARADCLVRSLVRTRFEEKGLELTEGEEFGVEITVPLPASSAGY